MIGRRIDGNTKDEASRFPYPELKPGDYGKDLSDNTWYCVPPCEYEILGWLAKHTVIEHEDGTITVCPSILIQSHLGNWHGFIEKGVWREC